MRVILENHLISNPNINNTEALEYVTHLNSAIAELVKYVRTCPYKLNLSDMSKDIKVETSNGNVIIISNGRKLIYTKVKVDDEYYLANKQLIVIHVNIEHPGINK